MLVHYEELGRVYMSYDQKGHISNYVEMSEEEYHSQMATKDWTTIMSFPMVLLAIQIIIGLRQFVDPEDQRTHQRAQQTPSPRRMNRRFNSIRQFLQQNYDEQTF